LAAFVCLLGLCSTLLKRFSQNSVKIWNMGHERNDYSLVGGNLDYITLGLW